MEKQVIFTPRKSFASAAKGALMAIRDMGAESAAEIGIEVVKIDGVFYTVKNPYKPQDDDLILDTANASERYSVLDIQTKSGV